MAQDSRVALGEREEALAAWRALPAESRRRAESLCRQARDSLAPLGPAGDRLAALAQYVVERNC